MYTIYVLQKPLLLNALLFNFELNIIFIRRESV